MTREKAEVPFFFVCLFVCFFLIVITKYSQKIHNYFVGVFNL